MTPSRQNNPVEPSSGREAAPAPERGKGPAGRRPRLNLPFDNRREDAGSWAYDHRVGLCATLIAYLVVMIVFVSSKIVIGQRAQTQGMFIDLQTLSELEEQREQLEEEVNATDMVTKMKLFGSDAKSLYELDQEYLARTYSTPSPLAAE